MYSLCNDWEFTRNWTESFLRGEGRFEKVRLPHNIEDLPLHYASPDQYESICGYRQLIFVSEESRGKRLVLQFDGAAHIAYVYVNGKLAAEHRTGYTAFRTEITDLIQYGAENMIAVKLDTTENPTTPPFGFVIDYLTYSGLYREAWLDIRNRDYISDIYVTTPDLQTAHVVLSVDGSFDKIRLSVMDGTDVAATCESTGLTVDISCPDALPWDVDSPK